MERLLPIEPGARCLYIGRSGTQEVVTLRPAPYKQKVDAYTLGVGSSGRWWELDRPITWARDGVARPYCTEKNLLRIDGNPDQSISKEAREPVEAFY